MSPADLIRGSTVQQDEFATCCPGALSTSAAWIDQTLKLRHYEAVASIRSYVLISQDGTGRFGANTALLIEGLAASITLPEPSITLPLALLYEDLDVEPFAP